MSTDFSNFDKAIMNIYDNIKEIADRKGLPIYKVEDKAGISRGSLRKWNEVSPSINNLLKVSKTLRVSVNRLIR